MNNKNVLPGFGLTMGVTLFLLGLVVILPLSALFLKTAGMGWTAFIEAISSPRVLFAYRLSLFCSLAAALINLFVGLLVAWVLARYQFPGKRILNMLIDLPFALPTAVAGITLTALYAPDGAIGKIFNAVGIPIVFSPLGITLALVFIGFPFVVRTVEPVLADLDTDMEEASACLGAGRLKTFWSIILPPLKPALLTGFSLAFARGLGEYGSVVFISGNLPLKTEIAPLMIISKLEQYDYTGATAIACVMLVAAFLILLTINILQWKYIKQK
ncbi:sulfate ABC transporter permease subunit CysT [bacterium]|nr:sulfate ABC transporter permease subunit CysT [bacterium]